MSGNEQQAAALKMILWPCPTAHCKRKRQSQSGRRERERLHKKNQEKMEETYAATRMNACLQNRISYNAWDRLVLQQGFETPSKMKARCHAAPQNRRRHSPSAPPAWNTDAVLQSVETWPAGKVMNWSKFAQDHSVPGKNRGQVVKEFLQQQGVDVLRLENRAAPRFRMRRRRLTFGCDVTYPANNTSQKIIDDIRAAIASNRFNIGEECCSTLIYKYSLTNGDIDRKEVQVYGRKIPMLELRRYLLDQHKAKGLMRSHPDTLVRYASMQRNEVIDRLRNLGEYD